MNDSQNMENTLLLEKKVQEQAETIRVLEKKVEGIHTVVYQLVGGLFNQRTQDLILEKHLYYLFPELYSNKNFEDIITNDLDTWPTTRQGDKNSERINELERQIRDLKQNFYEEEVCASQINVYDENMYDEVLSVSSNSTHSSMPELIDIDSDGDSMPELIDIDSDGDSIPELIDDDTDDDSNPELYSESLREISLRLRNSFDLCGNA